MNYSNKMGKKIIYIATGSMISLRYNICINLIDNLIHNNFHVVMSNNTEYARLNKYYRGNVSVYIDKFIPQQYVLSNSSLFISSAGQNSILEAIYHKVPILAIPLTSEQKLNGLLIEGKKIGKTVYIERSEYISLGTLIKQLLTDEVFQINLEKENFDLINTKNNFNELLNYVYEKKEKIKNFCIG